MSKESQVPETDTSTRRCKGANSSQE